MANEIQVSMSLVVSNGSFKFRFQPGGLQFDQTGTGGGNPGLVSVGTSEENIALGDITTEGWVVMMNLDATNYVEWGGG